MLKNVKNFLHIPLLKVRVWVLGVWLYLPKIAAWSSSIDNQDAGIEGKRCKRFQCQDLSRLKRRSLDDSRNRFRETSIGIAKKRSHWFFEKEIEKSFFYSGFFEIEIQKSYSGFFRIEMEKFFFNFWFFVLEMEKSFKSYTRTRNYLSFWTGSTVEKKWKESVEFTAIDGIWTMVYKLIIWHTLFGQQPQGDNVL